LTEIAQRGGMGINIRLTLSLLLPAALVLLLVACGGTTEPTPDIDAIVEAKVKEALAAQATPTPLPTPTPEIVIAASTPTPTVTPVPVATVEPARIYTPVPTPTPTPSPTVTTTPTPMATPTPTPTPVPNAQSIIDQSKIVMFNLESFRADDTWRFESPNFKVVSTGYTEYQTLNKSRIGKMEFANDVLHQLQISDKCYEEIDWFGETKWRVAECEEEFDNGFSPEKVTVLDLDIESYPVIKDYEGSTTYYINSGELKDISQMSQTTYYEAFFTDEGSDKPTSYKIEYWIDRDSLVLRKIKFIYYIDSISDPASTLGKVGDPLEIEITAIYSAINEIKEEIVAPPVDSDRPVATATPPPTATPNPAASSTPNTICELVDREGHTDRIGDIFWYLSNTPSQELETGPIYQTTGAGQALPDNTCAHHYSFWAVAGVSYAISVYIHNIGLQMWDSFIDLFDQNHQLIAVNDDYADGSLGSRISFTAEYGGLYHFLVGEMDNASDLTYKVQVFSEPSNQKLVFVSDFTGTRELFLATYSQQREKFHDLMQLTDNGYATHDPRFGYESKEAYSEMQPVFSPSGIGIAYVSNANGNNDIYITYAQGPHLGVSNWLYTSDPGNDSHPSWHPSGEYLAFNTTRNGKIDIYTVDVMHRLPEPLIQMSERHAYDPEYSPDGKLVAFNANLVSGDGLTDIYIHNIATGENTNITNTDMTNVGQHDWSPDGSKLIFRADPDATDTYHPNQLEIFTINRDGSNLVQITNNEKLDASPKWSEDGTSIYFVSHENQEQPKIYIMNADGSNTTRATTFSSSMQEIYFDIWGMP
jgi:hypothetical protein